MGVEIFEEDEAELVGNGHFDVVACGQLQGGSGGGDALGHAVGGAEDVVELFASGQAATELLVAAEWGGAGGDQVADARQAGKGERVGSGSDA